MDYNEYLAQTICELLKGGLNLALAYIVSQDGSAPRHVGTKMVIGADGVNYGTIGGSSLESNTIKEAKTVLGISQSKLLNFDLANNNANIPGMLCGGHSTVLLEYLKATPESLDFFQSLYNAMMGRDDFIFITLFKNDNSDVSSINHCLWFNNEKIIGNCPLPLADLERLITNVDSSSTAFVLFNGWQILLESMHKTKTLYCFGAGHVAKPTAHIAALVGFRVIVVDDRAEYCNVIRFPDVWEVYTIDDFSHALKDLHIDKDSFIVIFTREHLYDRVVLEQALNTNAGYIGMIASHRKKITIYQALKAKGVTEEDLERVHSPIGLEIDAETPEEIAVSIVAELIKERSRIDTSQESVLQALS